MKKKGILFFVVCLFCVSIVSISTKADNANYGDDAYYYMRYLNDVYPDRVQNTQQVHEAGEWIKGELESFGYQVEVHSYDAFGMKINNYIVEKKGNSPKTVYIGGHYDCVAGETKGADDNASGVGVTLELAKRFVDVPTDVTLKFCFWDAEEEDYMCAGSYLYTENMTQEEINNMLCFINLDVVGAGDYLHAYSGYYDENQVLQDIWPLNMVDSISAKLGITLKHIPEQITRYKSPTRPTGSDQQFFFRKGASYIYFEASAWIYPDGTTNPNQWLLTTTHPAFKDVCGQIMHLPYDNMDVIEAAMPGRIKTNLTNISKLVTQMLREFTVDAPQKYAPQDVPPTTEAPTTEAPTTEAPTTEAPTTEAPTTEAPTTEAPTTEAPTTEAPTTEAPTTEAPTTEAPTTEAPTTEELTTELETTTQESITQESSSEEESSEQTSIVEESEETLEQSEEESSLEEEANETNDNSEEESNVIYIWGLIILLILSIAFFIVHTMKKRTM